MNPRRLTTKELKDLFKPPEDKWDEKWLQIPTFMRKRVAAIPDKQEIDEASELN